MIQVKNHRYRIVQEAKRQWLNISLNVYEIKIQEYQQEYQYQLIQLEKQFLNSTILNSSVVYNHVEEYLNYQAEKLKRDIYSKMSAFRGKLIQHRQRSSAAKHSIGVSPEPYLDLMSNPFNTREWNYLSLGTIVFLRHVLFMVFCIL